MLKKILLTGASGFLGKEIDKVLNNSYTIITMSRAKDTSINCDISKEIPTLPKVDYVVHAAGKAHLIPKNKLEADEFHKTNYEGTVSLTRALELSGLPSSFVLISSVSVYGLEQGEFIEEGYPLKGSTPYALSKIKAEKFIIDWGQKNKVKVTVLRLPLVAGYNPPGNLGAFKRAIIKGYYFRISGGLAQKSMVWAQDIAAFLPQCFGKTGTYNLTDGHNPKMREIDNAIAKVFNKKVKKIHPFLLSMLVWPSNIVPFWPLNKTRVNKLTQSLTFSSAKAVEELNWKPRSVIDCIEKYGI